MPFRIILGNQELRPGGSRRRQAVAVESLEGRALLTHMAIAPHAATHATADVLKPFITHPGPIHDEIGVGYAVKIPRLYPFYTGPKRAELNAAGLKAQLDGQGNLVLTGIVAGGDIPQTPTSTDLEGHYFFGINRGGVTTAGQIPHRPGIVFDAIVEVDITQAGIATYVADTNTGAAQDLPAGSLLFKPSALQVTVPLTLLPSTGAPPENYTVAFATGSEASTGSVNSLASFAPEFRNVQVGRATLAVQPLAAASVHHHHHR